MRILLHSSSDQLYCWRSETMDLTMQFTSLLSFTRSLDTLRCYVGELLTPLRSAITRFGTIVFYPLSSLPSAIISDSLKTEEVCRKWKQFSVGAASPWCVRARFTDDVHRSGYRRTNTAPAPELFPVSARWNWASDSLCAVRTNINPHCVLWLRHLC